MSKQYSTERLEKCGASSKLLSGLLGILKECTTETEQPIHIERLKHYMEQFIDSSQDGFWVRNTGNIVCLIERLSEKFYVSLRYRSWIIKLLQITRISPIMCTPMDSLTYENDLAEYFSMFGEVLLWAPDREVLSTVSKSLNAIFVEDHPYLACVPKHRCVELVVKSRLPYTLVDLMKISDFPEYAKLLVCVKDILQTHDVGSALLKSDILNVLFKNIGAPTISGESPDVRSFLTPIPTHFHVSLAILWKLVDTLSHSTLEGLMSMNPEVTSESWRYCHVMFKKLTLLRHMKHLRNSFFACVVNIFIKCPKLHYSSDFVQDWAMMITATELGTLGTWASSLIFTNEPAEYEFKKSLFISVAMCAKDSQLSRVLIQRDIYQCIFNILTPEIKVIWTRNQRNDLMIYALGALDCLVKTNTDAFLFVLGPNRLIRVIRNGRDGVLPSTVLTPCLRCIYSSLLANDQIMRQYRKRGAFDTILSLTGIFASSRIMTCEAQEAIVLCFCILGMIQGHTQFRGTTLDISLCCLNRYLKPIDGDTMLHPNVLISAIEFLWATVTSHRDAPELFVENSGIFILLDVLQKAPLLIKIIILGFVADLCYYDISLPLLLSWRGRNGVTLTEVLLETFRKENKLIGATIDEEGLILDLENPLVGKLQRSLIMKKFKEGLCSSPCILDMYGSCRPKISAILSILKYQKAPRANIINQNYTVQLKQLNRIDQMTMCVAINYFMLKKGECWVELNKEFQSEGILLLTFDQELIDAHTEAYYDMLFMLKRKQLKENSTKHVQEMVEEKLFYNMLGETFKPNVMDCLTELNRISRCSNKSFMARHKRKQLNEILGSLSAIHHSNVNFHNTFPYDTTVCNVFNQRVNLRGNVRFDEHTSLISVMDDKCELEESASAVSSLSNLNV